jgi:hypothetical protein
MTFEGNIRSFPGWLKLKWQPSATSSYPIDFIAL